jgi:hypothetical protein
MQFMAPFVNTAGSRNLNVNGSIEPVIFSFAPQAPTQILSLNCVLLNAGATAFNNYFDSLPKGILLQFAGNGYQQLIRSKTDLVSCFTANTVEPLISSNFIGTATIYTGSPLILQPGQAIQASVQDNLSSIGVLSFFVQAIQ